MIRISRHLVLSVMAGNNLGGWMPHCWGYGVPVPSLKRSIRRPAQAVADSAKDRSKLGVCGIFSAVMVCASQASPALGWGVLMRKRPVLLQQQYRRACQQAAGHHRQRQQCQLATADQRHQKAFDQAVAQRREKDAVDRHLSVQVAVCAARQR